METSSPTPILIVDDNPTNLKVLFDVLHQAGFKVSVATSGLSALDKVKEILPELIILDVMMPEIDGFETCRRLKNQPTTKDIPVIFMTALSEPIDKVKGLQLGAVDYITKPIQLDETLARIHVQLNLRRTQLQLIREEKMVALGQLMASVAHEINNPVNFVHGNLPHARTYTQDLLHLLQLYETHVPQPIAPIHQFARTIDLDFIKTDLLKLLESMEMGTARIQEIVGSLRQFSRAEEETVYELVDLHQGIDNTLILLSGQLKETDTRPPIDVDRRYGNLPLVECYSGRINQVFMNLVVNAIDAIDERFSSLSPDKQLSLMPQLTITTHCTEDRSHVEIRIGDNGIGMSPEVKRRIFDRFFTTKPSGKGTGLGLAITYAIIVEQHHGTLECHSVPNEGTEFVITLAVDQHL